MTLLEEKVIQVAAAVRRRFARRHSLADLDDVAQDAALSALLAIRGGRLDERKNVSGYLYRAARVDAALSAARARAVLTLSEHEAATNAAAYSHRAVRTEDGDDVVDLLPSGFPSPLEALERSREAAGEVARKVRRDRLIEAWLRDLDRVDAGAVSMLLGLEGDNAAGGVDEVAFRTGLGRARVLRAVRRFKAKVGQDRLRNARHVIQEEAAI